MTKYFAFNALICLFLKTCRAVQWSEPVSGFIMTDLLLKIFGAFLTPEVWWMSSTYNDRFIVLLLLAPLRRINENIYTNPPHNLLLMCLASNWKFMYFGRIGNRIRIQSILNSRICTWINSSFLFKGTVS
jgi:hypothetical protein